VWAHPARIGRVLNATLAELAKAGYSGLSVNEVAQAAGVHATSVYRRWPSKPDLVVAACLHSAEVVIDDKDTGTLRGDLEHLLGQVNRFLRSTPGVAIVSMAVAAADDVSQSAVVRRYWRERFVSLEGIVGRARARGEWPDSLDPMTIIECLIGPLYVRRFITHRKAGTVFIADLVGFVLDSIRARRPLRDLERWALRLLDGDMAAEEGWPSSEVPRSLDCTSSWLRSAPIVRTSRSPRTAGRSSTAGWTPARGRAPEGGR
jgi:AcrR family transcriptional regulator